MAKENKGGAGKFFGGMLFGLILAAIIVVLLMYLGILGFGKGTGSGDDNAKTTVEQSSDEKKEVSIEIEVKQEQYIVDGKEVTLDEIKELVSKDDETVSVRLTNNYASTKAWDDVQKLMTDLGIVPVE